MRKTHAHGRVASNQCPTLEVGTRTTFQEVDACPDTLDCFEAIIEKYFRRNL